MRIVCLILSIALTLSIAGCGSNNGTSDVSEESLQASSAVIEEVTNETDEEYSEEASHSSDENDLTESEDESSTEDLPPIEEPKEDLLGLIADHGEDLVCYGDLTDSQYSDSLARLNEVLKGYNKNVAFVAYGLDDYKAVSYNTEALIFPASMIKSAYALYCCKRMEAEGISLDTKMVYEKKHYEIGTGDMQYSPIGTEFDLRTIISKAMSISDNVGYLMMVDYFGREGYNQWITELGAPSLQIKPTVWCLRANAKEWALVWREIYNYFGTDSEYARFLYDCSTNTAGNFATAGLESPIYSHKQGHQRSGDWHSYSDAGILWKENKNYVFVILTDAPGPSSYEAQFFIDIMNIVDSELFN